MKKTLALVSVAAFAFMSHGHGFPARTVEQAALAGNAVK